MKEQADLFKILKTRSGFTQELQKQIIEESLKEGISAADDKKWTIVLFDEVEKAHQAVHDLFLGIMAEGFVDLSNQQRVDLSNVCLIMTSNIGARSMGTILRAQNIGFHVQETEGKPVDLEALADETGRKIRVAVEKEIDRTFKTEFKGRIDEVVIFRPHSAESLRAVIRHHLDELTVALAERGILLTVQPEVDGYIFKASLHRPEVGARLLTHKTKKIVKLPLGRLLGKMPEFRGQIDVYLNSSGRVTIRYQKAP